MNLLELMLKEEVEWPVAAEFAVQDYSGKIKFADKQPVCNGKYYQWEECWVSHAFNARERLDKWNETIITREEYQTAGGWMKWEGGKHPVSDDQLTETKWSHGEVITDVFCSQRHWDVCERDDQNIIAYRVISQQPVQLDNPEIEPALFAARETEGAEKPCDKEWKPLRCMIGNMAEESEAEHAATSKQSAPKGSGSPILGMVLADLTNRALEGKEKYGEPLKAHNGRNALWDAYQEALDLAMYLRQLIQEQQDA